MPIGVNGDFGRGFTLVLRVQKVILSGKGNYMVALRWVLVAIKDIVITIEPEVPQGRDAKELVQRQCL